MPLRRRESPIGAEDAERRPRPGARPIVEKVGWLGRHFERLRRLGAVREQRSDQLVDPAAGGARDAEHADQARIRDRERCRLAREIGLVEDDELRALIETGAVERELAVDDLKARVGVAV